jgi:hypothetical protein
MDGNGQTLAQDPFRRITRAKQAAGLPFQFQSPQDASRLNLISAPREAHPIMLQQQTVMQAA